MRAYRDEGFPVTIVRPSMTYDRISRSRSGGGAPTRWPTGCMRGRPIIVHGDGSSLWVVTHADDLARGLLGLLGNERALGEAFHITSDEVLTWNQIYQTIAEALGVEAKIVHIPSDFIARVAPQLAGSLLGDKTWSVVFDNSKIKSFVPGFEATVPFRDGIRRTLEWFAADEASADRRRGGQRGDGSHSRALPWALGRGVTRTAVRRPGRCSMEYRELGRTGWKVSAIGLGTWAMGSSWGAVDDAESLATLNRALDLGVNFFDTADVYGSEPLLGRLRRERERAVLHRHQDGRAAQSGSRRRTRART